VRGETDLFEHDTWTHIPMKYFEVPSLEGGGGEIRLIELVQTNCLFIVLLVDRLHFTDLVNYIKSHVERGSR
jgi:hypothetical protein